MGAELDSFGIETQLREQLKDRLGLASQIHLADEQYWLTPLHDVTDLIERECIYDLAYRDEVNDCDDFAHMLADAMIRSQWQNQKRQLPHAFGEVWGRVPAGGHALNIMINSDGAVRFVEPQAELPGAVMTPAECDMSEIWMVKM